MGNGRLWVFDLDGTLIDVKKRYYSIHRDLINEFGGQPMAPDAYWRLKRKGTGEETIAAKAGLKEEKGREYVAKRPELLESFRYLSEDSLFRGAGDVLGRLGKNSCILATRRRNRGELERQLHHLDIFQAFRLILSDSGASGSKYGIFKKLRRENQTPGLEIFSVSDSPRDIQDSKKFGFKTIGISGGMREKRLILDAQPDRVIGSVSDLLKQGV